MPNLPPRHGFNVLTDGVNMPSPHKRDGRLNQRPGFFNELPQGILLPRPFGL
jgi:hypothetical protein